MGKTCKWCGETWCLELSHTNECDSCWKLRELIEIDPALILRITENGRFYRLVQTIAEIALNEDWDNLPQESPCYAAKKRALGIIRERNQKLYEAYKKEVSDV